MTSTQKPDKNGQCEKVVQSKRVAKNGYDDNRLMAKIVITIIQVNFVLISRMKQHKLT